MGNVPLPGRQLRACGAVRRAPSEKIGAGEKTKLFSFAILGKVAVIAVPSILQQSFISVGNIVIQSVINTFGSEVMAGYSAAVKLNNMVVTSLTTLGNGISNYTAQNMGAGKHARVKQGFRAGLPSCGSSVFPSARCISSRASI